MRIYCWRGAGVTTNASQTHDHESGHGKDHGHDHGSSDSSGTGHGHGVAADADRRWLSIALALISMRLSARPARGIFTYGLRRTEILSAQANGLTLLLLSVWLTYEAIRRLIDPGPVAGGLVLITAGVGIVVNLAAAWAISKANRSSLNVEGAFQHILTDLYGFIATAVAGLVVMLTGFAR